jgi:glycosyltransferase involved in cell wall biosynthesis
MKVLFIARTYPPSVGGLQKFCIDFYTNYKKIGDIDLLANTGGNIAMPIFVLKVLIALIFRSRNYDVIHFSDAVLASLLPVAKAFSNAQVTFTVHGLDIVYSRFGYQKLILPFLRRADRAFAVSQYTLEQCVHRGFPMDKLKVIPNCINFEYLPSLSQQDKEKIITKFKIDLRGKKVLLTVGRLIKRKGHIWFIKNVLTRLSEEYIYVIAGSGPESDAIKFVIQECGLSGRAYLLGRVSEDEKKYLFQMADLFIMPNISVEGDQEGFGIVLLEAGGYGIPVIASNLEGIQDAVIEGKTGRLLQEGDKQEFINAILHPNIDTTHLKDLVTTKFSCKKTADLYYNEFKLLK